MCLSSGRSDDSHHIDLGGWHYEGVFVDLREDDAFVDSIKGEDCVVVLAFSGYQSRL